jgi:hypothetical protein
MRPFSKRVTLLLITSLATKSSHVCTSFVLATPTEPTSRDSSLSQNFPSDGVRMSARKSNVLSLRMTEPAEVDSLEYTPDKVWKYVQQGECQEDSGGIQVNSFYNSVGVDVGYFVNLFSWPCVNDERPDNHLLTLRFISFLARYVY